MTMNLDISFHVTALVVPCPILLHIGKPVHDSMATETRPFLCCSSGTHCTGSWLSWSPLYEQSCESKKIKKSDPHP